MSANDKDDNSKEEYIDIDDEAQAEQQQPAYAWEEEYKRSWDVLQEDEDGSLRRIVEDLQNRMKRKRLLRDTSTIRRGIIRHMILVLDLSESMLEKDLRPSRLELTLSYMDQFIVEYFDQNPISQLGIVTTRDGLSEKLTELSGNPMDHMNALKNKKNTEPEGEPSLQNALEMARTSLIHVPGHGSREVLIIFGSLTTCDPGNIYDTISQLQKDSIRVSVVGLAAEVQICRYMAKETKGSYRVVLNEPHYKDLLFDLIPPPPITSSSHKSELVVMGFPTRVSSLTPSFCACHQKLVLGGYICPRCTSKICDLPTECDVCGLMLISSPHLARSYHHLFPVENFVEVPWNSVVSTECYACQIPYEKSPPPISSRSGQIPVDASSGRYSCPKCLQHFCVDCDVFIHEVLHNCPGCLGMTARNGDEMEM